MAVILKNARIFDTSKKKVFSGSVILERALIKDVLEEKEPPKQRGAEEIDLAGKYLLPGLIDAHLHIESSMLSPIEFSLNALKHGTTSIFVDPNEIANVKKEGINLFLEIAQKLPIDMFIGVPSCVPATHLENSGAEVTLEDISSFLEDQRVYGLAEMMNFPAIIQGFGNSREKVALALSYAKVVDGHCPGVRGEELKKYISNGELDDVVRIMSDHESTTFEEAKEKAELGMYVALRYGSASKDLDKILAGLIQNQTPLDKFMLCSDDLSPEDLLEKGHMDRVVKRAREIIMENSDMNLEQATLKAVSMATSHPINYFLPFFQKEGKIIPGEIKKGRKANLVILNSLEEFEIDRVYYEGRLLVENGKLRFPKPSFEFPSEFLDTVRLHKPLTPQDFVIKPPVSATSVKVKLIELVPNSLLTKKVELELPLKNGEIKSDPERDILKIAVIERHKATGSYSVGLVKGLGIKRGAIASTVAHDSHNMIIAGVDESAMAKAGNLLREKGGGMVIVDGDNIESLSLKLAGLMSIEPIEDVVNQYRALKARLKEMGSQLENAFMSLSFLALPVIPELKITDRGIVDVNKFELVSLID